MLNPGTTVLSNVNQKLLVETTTSHGNPILKKTLTAGTYTYSFVLGEYTESGAYPFPTQVNIVVQDRTSGVSLLASTANISQGVNSITFTVTGSGNREIWMMSPVPNIHRTQPFHFALDDVIVTEEDASLYTEADVISYQDYYPFGMNMDGRYATGDDYRYGLNGQEQDNEVYGNGNSYTAQFWQYDSRLGRRWNADPRPNPSISQFATFANNPIWYSDPLGDTIKFAEGSTQEFIDQINAYMKKVSSTEEGEKVISELKNSKNIFTIEEINGVLNSQFESLMDEDGNLTGDGIIRVGIGFAKADNVNFNGQYAFAHESFHAFQLNSGKTSFRALNETTSLNGMTKLVEVQAVGFENYIRGSLNEKGFNTPRLHYTTKEKVLGKTVSTQAPLLEYSDTWGNWLLNGKEDWDMNDFLRERKSEWLNMHNETTNQYLGVDGTSGAR